MIKVSLVIVVLLAGCSSDTSRSRCDYLVDEYTYTKKVYGKHSTRTINAKVKALNCVAR